MTSGTGKTDGERRPRSLPGVRARLPVVAVVLCCVAAVVVAVSGAASSIPGLQFLPPGHWVFNAALQSVFHVDGATASVDAVAEEVPGSAGSLVVQGDTSGYVVGDSRITEFGKSSLAVSDSYDAPSDGSPIGLEVAGGPYLVYQGAGKIVRLGEQMVTISAGGAVGIPVATSDGTVWLPRAGEGLLCRLAPGADRVTCPVRLPKDHSGAMSVLDDKPVFVDTSADTVHTVEADGLGAPRTLGVDVSDGSRVASTDASGRLVILDQKAHRMHLVDLTGATKPVVIELPGDSYDGPVANGSVIAVVDRKAGTLNTYDTDGVEQEKTPLPQESGTPRITRGEDDRMYVDSADGDHVLVVDRDGSVAQVPVDMDESSATEADEDRQQDRNPPTGGTPPQNPPQNPPQGSPDDSPQDDAPQQSSPPQQDRPSPPPQQDLPDPGPPEVPASPPGTPAGVAATPADGSATVSWGAAPDNRAPITGYSITWPGGATSAAPDARSATVSGLANGTSYVFTVTATNAVGTGPGTSSAPVTPQPPFRAAAAPTNLAADNETSNSTVWATWNAPADLGTGTFVHYQVDIVGVRQATVTETSVTYNDINIDQELTINITAVTTSPDGQQVPGATATVITGQDSGGTAEIALSRGPATTEWCGPDPACAWMHVVLTGFPANSQILVVPHSTDAGYSNGGHTFDTDANGYAEGDQFAYAGTGFTVHVKGDLNGEQIRSNDVAW